MCILVNVQHLQQIHANTRYLYASTVGRQQHSSLLLLCSFPSLALRSADTHTCTHACACMHSCTANHIIQIVIIAGARLKVTVSSAQ